MTNPIGALFGRSPIRPIQSHLRKTQGCVELSLQIFELTANDNWPAAEELRDQISEAAGDADEIMRDIRAHLPNSLMLPFARGDLLELLQFQDQLADSAKSLANIVCRRKQLGPAAFGEQLHGHLAQSAKASRLALSAINELDELLETGFRGREASRVETVLNELDSEFQASIMGAREVEDALFELESELSPVDAVFLYKIIDLISSFATISQQIGSRLLLIMAR